MADRDTTEIQMIGSRIKEVRIKKGMSQAELAAKANISLPHISNIELGKCSMMMGSFIRIIAALQVSSDTIIRPNVPEVRNIYEGELSDVFSGCTPAQMDSILKIVKELKQTMHNSEEQ